MKPKDSFEYGGSWVHATEEYSKQWRKKGVFLIPPVEAYHFQLILLKHLGLEAKMNLAYAIYLEAGIRA